ncbi:MAG: hypothetical protein ACOX9R_15845 [Armatimonadota bacterium]|jgi:hypothetical protein
MTVIPDTEKHRDRLLQAMDEAEPSIDERRARWRAFWDMRQPPERPMRAAAAGDVRMAEQHIFEHRVARFIATAPDLVRDCPDYVPVLSTTVSAHQQASAFGCETFLTDPDGSIWSRPLLQRYDPDAALGLELPAVSAGLQGASIELARETERFFDGRVGTRIPDMQGPLDVAGQVLGPEHLLRMLIEHPDAARHVIGLATQLLIDFYRAMEAEVTELVGPHCPPGLWCPPELGNAVSEDYAPLVSRAMYEEFSLPYIQRIADETGGLFIHCCGEFEHTCESMASIEGLTGMNPAIPVLDWPQFAAAFADVCVLAPSRSIGAERWPEMASFHQYLLDNTPEGAHLVLP